jgi:general secretion pathway protein H
LIIAFNRRKAGSFWRFNPAAKVSRGFTLVELLVVMVVIGVGLGLVVLQLAPDKRAPLREEAGRLALLLENAGLEARASGRPFAWTGEKNGYQFLTENSLANAKKWVRIEDDSPFRPRTLAAGVNIGEVTVEEQTLKPGEYVILNANSFAVPFQIGLSSEYGFARVSGKSTGDVVFTLDDQKTESVTP